MTSSQLQTPLQHEPNFTMYNRYFKRTNLSTHSTYNLIQKQNKKKVIHLDANWSLSISK